jgi:hypothetical protein
LGRPSQEETIKSLRQDVRWINEKINTEGRTESLKQKMNIIIQDLEYIKAKAQCNDEDRLLNAWIELTEGKGRWTGKSVEIVSKDFNELLQIL